MTLSGGAKELTQMGQLVLIPLLVDDPLRVEDYGLFIALTMS